MSKNALPSVDNVMTFMTSLARRRKFFGEMDIRFLRIFRADVCRALDEREAILRAEEDQERERQSKIYDHLEQLRKDGIAPDELLVATKQKKRPSIGPIRTYRVNGELIHYKGVGKYPRKLKAIIDKEGEAALARYEEAQ